VAGKLGVLFPEMFKEEGGGPRSLRLKLPTVFAKEEAAERAKV